MKETLELFIRQRCRELGMSMSQLCREADISRQTLYELWKKKKNASYPSLNVVVNLAHCLKVHPIRILQFVFHQESHPETAQPISGDRSAFVADVTYPDGARVLTESQFTKTWTLQNVGEVPWEDRALACQDTNLTILTPTGDQLNLAESLTPSSTWIPLPIVKPGETLDISVDFTAPRYPGTVISYWKMVNKDGSYCFEESKGLWVKVQVESPANYALADRES